MVLTSPNQAGKDGPEI